MSELTMPFKSVKKLIRKEVEEHMDNVSKVIHAAYLPDVQSNIAWIARIELLKRIDACETLEQLEDFMGYANYRMSVQDWIDSL